MHRALDRPSDNLDRREDLGRVLDERRDEERPVHHETTHATSTEWDVLTT